MGMGILRYTVILLLLAGCSKEKDMPPFVPWNPDSQEEETISLDDATQVMILPEQAGGRVVMIDVPTGKVGSGSRRTADCHLQRQNGSIFRTRRNRCSTRHACS